MKITKTVKYDLTFSVVHAEGQEGGMDYHVYHDGIQTLEEAIHKWELAVAAQRPGDKDEIFIRIDPVVTIN